MNQLQPEKSRKYAPQLCYAQKCSTFLHLQLSDRMVLLLIGQLLSGFICVLTFPTAGVIEEIK